MERGRARRSSFKGRERAIVNQTNIGTVSYSTMRKLLRDGEERIKIMGFSERIYTILYRTDLNRGRINAPSNTVNNLLSLFL